MPGGRGATTPEFHVSAGCGGATDRSSGPCLQYVQDSSSGREIDRRRGVSDADPRPFVTGNCRAQGGAIASAPATSGTYAFRKRLCIQVEPDGLVLRALIEAISTPAGFHFRNVKIGILTQSIFNPL